MSLKKISIIGAGQVGSNLAFLLLIRKISEEIVLVDIQKDLAEAIKLDLEDSRFFFSSNINIKASNKLNSIISSDIVIITAGKPRGPGMSREDLIKINSSIIKEISFQIRKEAPSSIVIVITNPLDLMTYLTLKTTNFSWRRVIGMGSSLDSGRLANLISKKLKINVEKINPVVFGSHGKNMLISSLTSIYGFPLNNFLNKKDFNKLKNQTINRGAEIVNLLKKGSAKFAPASSCLNIIEAIAFNKRELTFASSYLNGQYGLKGVCLGVPVIIGDRGIEKILELDISKEDKNILKQAEVVFKKYIKFL